MPREWTLADDCTDNERYGGSYTTSKGSQNGYHAIWGLGMLLISTRVVRHGSKNGLVGERGLFSCLLLVVGSVPGRAVAGQNWST